MSAALKTMREVVERLRREDAEALLELHECVYAMTEMLRHLETLAGVLQALHSNIAALAAKEEDRNRLEAILTLEGNSGRASVASEQIVAAFRQICGALGGWGAAEVNHP